MRALLIFCLVFCSISTYSQSYWVQKQAGGNVDETLACTSDNSGNSYLTGYFSTSATINGTPKSVNGLTDVFITKTSLNGNNLWVQSFGGSGSDRGLDIAVDATGNVYVCGFYKNTINFGSGVSISSSGNSQDAFLAKFNSLGNILWAKSFGSTGESDQANGIAVDGGGNVLVTGQFSGTANFDGVSLTSLGGSIDACTAKYNSAGDILWAKKGSGSSLDKGMAISTDAQGNSYVTGQFSGDIEFDNSYSNTIQNALFLIKYDANGSEQWFRWAGGTDQAIAYDLEVVGSSVYFVGDFGTQITFFGGSGSPNIVSTYSNAVFLASYSTSGSFNFGESMGSESAVSARGLDVYNNEIAIAGWFECTFNELSEHYGEVTFNNLGYRDIYVMRYSDSGNFLWARNFGSKDHEMAHDVTLLSDNVELIVGVYNSQLVIPVSDAVSLTGTTGISFGPNSGLTYCGDPNYGDFVSFPGPNEENGFALKVIDPNRSPFDFYQHYSSGCDLSIPESCIQPLSDPLNDLCEDIIYLCPGEQVIAVNQVIQGSQVGYIYSTSWNPPSNGPFIVNTPGTISATLTSEDGCYTSTATVEVDLHPQPDKPLISDNHGVNDMAEVPFPVIICPGETVDLTGFTNSGNTHTWSGPGIGNDNNGNNPVTVQQSGWYTFTVENEFGCIESNFIQVVVMQVPPDLIDPFITFPAIDDTMSICENSNAIFTVYDEAFNGVVPQPGYEWEWSANPGNFSSFGNSLSISVSQEGWYYITVEIEKEENECETEFPIYSLTDSVYIQVFPAPTAYFEITGPNYICPNDTVTLFIDYDGELNLDFVPLAQFEDSLWVFGAGVYGGSASNINEFGCAASGSSTLIIQEVVSPQITSSSSTGILCPGDSIMLSSNAVGTVIWQGPDGPFVSDTSYVFVSETGIYYTEVNYYEGCQLVSNSIEISEFTTPYISGSNAVLCEGDSVEISIISSAETDVSWLPPLSGNAPSQVIYEEGVYQAEITGCGVTTVATIEVVLNPNILEISQSDLTPVCEGDSILVEATLGYTNYQWSPAEGMGSEVYFHSTGAVQAMAIDSNNCELISNVIEISFESNPPMPNFTYDLVCEGDTQFIYVESNFAITFLDSIGGSLLQESGEVVIPNFSSDTTLYVYLSSEFCSGPINTLEISPIEYPAPPILSSNAPVCTGTYLDIFVDNSKTGVVYNWIGPDMTDEQGDNLHLLINSLDQAGLYTCFADRSGCQSDSAFIFIDLFETLQVVLPEDTGMCETNEIEITTNTTFNEYLWQDGSINSSFSPLSSGLISVITHDNNGCQSYDEMFLELINCDYDVPNVFTPNGDGLNDFWDFGIEDPRFFELIVFNRWGRKVFESTDNQVLWNGDNYKSDEPCSEGVYFYILRFINIENIRYEVTGHVTIIR